MPVAPGKAREQDGQFTVTATVTDGAMAVVHCEEITVPLEMIDRGRSRRETLIEAMHRLAMERAYFHAERLRRERPEEGI